MAKINSTTHNDESAIQCELNREDLRALIIRQIQNASPPKAMAIHGTWGTGKTSLMKQLYQELGGDYFDRREGKGMQSAEKNAVKGRKIKPVWFEAWQYQHEENILAALLREIRNQLAWHFKLMKNVEEAAVPTMLSVLQSVDLSIEQFGVKFGFKGVGDRLVKNLEAHEKKNFSMPLESLTMKKLLEDAINKLIGLKSIAKSLNKNLGFKTTDGLAVIFIDDLDRCEPVVAYKILETIKVYLNLKNCVFVLGMDVEEVERILAKQYEKSMPPERVKAHAKLYLEKICQDVYHLNHPPPPLRQKYFKKLLQGRIPEETLPQIMAIAELHPFLPPIPRSIKILANVIISHMDAKIIKGYIGKTPDRLQKLMILCSLYAFHPEIYRLIYLYPRQDFYNSRFLPHCNNPNEKEEHPLLETLVFHEKISTSDNFSGSTSSEAADMEKAPLFPHESLRQVLWCRRMVIDDGCFFTDEDFLKLKL